MDAAPCLPSSFTAALRPVASFLSGRAPDIRSLLIRKKYLNVAEGVSMPYVIGIGLSVGVAMFARCVGFDRDRAFYPIVMTVIASYFHHRSSSRSIHAIGHGELVTLEGSIEVLLAFRRRLRMAESMRSSERQVRRGRELAPIRCYTDVSDLATYCAALQRIESLLTRSS